jgi:hypothetical protein
MPAIPSIPLLLAALRGALIAIACWAASGALLAQSFCSSDATPSPRALVERFINADCEACWRQRPAPAVRRGQVALDWIAPGSLGDDAPLSAAATRDATARLESLGRALPATAESVVHRRGGGPYRLRVAHGLPFNGYIAASIEMKPATGGPWTAWLALVETLPVGIEGSPVARNLVRNLLYSAWDMNSLLSKSEQARFFEARPMSLAAGANPERLSVVGWVEDARGRLVAVAQSRCPAEPAR